MKASDAPVGDSLVEQAVAEMVAWGGRLADPEQASARFARCQDCPLLSLDFKVKGVVVMPGVPQCTPCGCIASAKARVARYFSVHKLRVVPTTCPDPAGSRWADIDQNYT